MTTDLLLFRIGRELFAAELRAVEEAVDLTAVRQLPAPAASMHSVFTLRGALVPLFSPAGVLGVAPTEAATALVIRDGAGRIAIVADDVEDVLSVRADELRPVPLGEARNGGLLRGIVRRGTRLVAVVDLEALVAACRGAPQPEPA